MKRFLMVLAVAFGSPTSWAVPSSSRSRAAIERVQPQLKLDLESQSLALGSPIFIRIFKEEGVLELWVQGSDRFELFRTYPICSWSGQLGPKIQEGDMQSPEGFYYVNSGRMNALSTFHLSFNIGFPNTYDRALDRTGSFLMVHGDCVSIGCYAMTDPAIEEIWTLATSALSKGQGFFRVHVFPFRMTTENLAAQNESPWHGFWMNLKEGHDLFESTGWPPDTTVENKTYVFADQSP